ncbi:MAG: hypothetical protein JSR58_01295 [Verrucomicrobia bacterium]|nr:hypothetical protein [Verrucomicrobiota bacterium]
MMRSLLSKCLFASVAFHILLIWIFFTHPLFLQPYLSSIFGKSTAIPLDEEDIALSEKNVSMEEVFNQIVSLPPRRQIPFDYQHIVTARSVARSCPEEKGFILKDSLVADIPESSFPRGFFLPEPDLKTPNWILDTPVRQEVIASAPLSPLNLDKPYHSVLFDDLHFESIASDMRVDSGSTLAKGPLPTLEGETVAPKNLSSPAVLPSPTSQGDLIVFADPQNLPFSDTPTPESQSIPSEAPVSPSPLTPASSTLPAFASYGLPDSYATVDWSSDFLVDVRTYKREEGGFLFSLTILPKYDMSSKRMPQNILFLVDRTNAEGKHRFVTFKRAILRALPFLREGDRFNIVVVGEKVQKMSELSLAFNKKTVARAEEFLENEVDVSSGGNIFAKLPKAALMTYDSSEAPSILLLSDGGDEGKSEKQSRNIRAWVQQNKGEIALYAATIGRDNNTYLLDLLSTLSRGFLVNSDTHSALPRKVGKLVLDLRFPLAKEMSATLMDVSPGSHIEIFPPSFRLPNLFCDHPFVIWGKADTLSDFTLLLEGRNGDQLLSIQTQVSFAGATPDNHRLPKEWALQEKNLSYDTFLSNGASTDSLR